MSINVLAKPEMTRPKKFIRNPSALENFANLFQLPIVHGYSHVYIYIYTHS